MMIELNSNISMWFYLRDMSNFQLGETEKNQKYNKNIHRSSPTIHKTVETEIFSSELTLVLKA